MKNCTFAGRAFQAADLRWRLICTGLPSPYARAFIDEFVKWSTNSGPVWAVEHLKSIRNDLIRVHAGLEVLTFLRKNKNHQIGGIIGTLFRYSFLSETCFKRVLVAFSIYTGFMHKVTPEKAVLKMRCSVEKVFQPTPEPYLISVPRAALKLIGTLQPGEVEPLLLYQGSPSRKAPRTPPEIFSRPVGQSWLPKSTSVLQSEGLEAELDNIFGARGNELFCSVYHRYYQPQLEGLDLRLIDKSFLQGKTEFHVVRETYFNRSVQEPPICGKLIPLSKDGGFKTRWIASPFRVHQQALKPLGDALFEALKLLPWDCTFEQEKAFTSLQTALKAGKMIHAVDLSSATDHFPLDLQLAVLYRLFPNHADLVNLFRDLSRGLWSSDWGPVRWTTGQPMGLYPSFPSFAMVHGMLLFYLNGAKWNEDFFILGDDVVILNLDLYPKYLQALNELGCPFSWEKTISSNILTEFSGKIITANRILPKFKVKDRGAHRNSFMELYRTYGSRFRVFFPKRIRNVIDKVSYLMPPYGASISLGPSVSLEKQIADTESFQTLLSEERGGRLHVSFLDFVLQRCSPENKSSLYYRLGKSILKLAHSFVLKVQHAQKQTPIPLLGPDLTDVFEFIGFDPRLPAAGTENKPSDLLSLYERVIKKWAKQ